MSDVGNSARIPVSISAATPLELSRLMLKNNLNKGIEHRYFDISSDGKKWVAWYYEVQKLPIRAKEV
jgi:hypothetical protein